MNYIFQNWGLLVSAVVIMVLIIQIIKVNSAAKGGLTALVQKRVEQIPFNLSIVASGLQIFDLIWSENTGGGFDALGAGSKFLILSLAEGFFGIVAMLTFFGISNHLKKNKDKDGKPLPINWRKVATFSVATIACYAASFGSTYSMLQFRLMNISYNQVSGVVQRSISFSWDLADSFFLKMFALNGGNTTVVLGPSDIAALFTISMSQVFIATAVILSVISEDIAKIIIVKASDPNK